MFYSSNAHPKRSICHSETIIFSMDHQQSRPAWSNRYTWIRWSCPHARCQRVTNNRVAAHYSLTSFRGWQLAFIHIYVPLSCACFFKHHHTPKVGWPSGMQKKNLHESEIRVVWRKQISSAKQSQKVWIFFHIWPLMTVHARLEGVYLSS